LEQEEPSSETREVILEIENPDQVYDTLPKLDEFKEFKADGSDSRKEQGGTAAEQASLF
jgi:hypothetical protein